ncbi:MAG: ArsA family ATPase [Syntrophales bacterium]|nr:ArsA family ATPase [Syntrophales bacterium]
MRVVFFTGKGGVGKSTLAAAAAWQLARKYRVLIVSLDPAHNLGDVFNEALQGKRKRLTPNLFLEEVDLRRMAQEYLERETQVLSDTYNYLKILNLDRYFTVLKYSPGIEEYALLTGIERVIREEAAFDYLLFDTPPTGLTLRFLALPQVTITWIDRLVAVRRQILERRYTIQKIRRPLREGEEEKAQRLTYSEDEDAILNHLKGLRENYHQLTQLLQGPACGIVLVCNPDLLSLRESERLIEGLHELGLPLRLIIQNKVTAENAAVAAEVVNTLRKKAGDDFPVRKVALNKDFGTAGARLYDIPESLEDDLVF